MAWDHTDWTIDRTNGNIRYVGDDHNGTAPTYVTTIEFHRALQALADDEIVAQTGDEVAIYDEDPSQRVGIDNIVRLKGLYNIDDGASEHIYDGSILQGSGVTETIYDGFQNFGNATAQIQIIQNGQVLSDDWWNKSVGGTATAGASANVLEDTGETWTVDEWVGYTIYNTTEGCQGICTENDATTITVGDLYGGTNQDFASGDTYVIGKPLNPDSTLGISHRFMLKVRDYGVDIDGRRVRATARRYGNTYAQFFVNGTGHGNNTLAVTDGTDLNNSTAYATIDGYSGITVTEGFRQIDVNDDGTAEDYASEWNTNQPTRSINDFYERLKLLTADGSTSTINGINGELYRFITHEIEYATEIGGGPVENKLIVWGATAEYDASLATPGTPGEFYDFSLSGSKGMLLAIDTAGAEAIWLLDGTISNNDVVTRSDGTASDGHTVDTNIVDNGTVGGVGLVIADDGTDQVWVQLLVGVAPTNGMLLHQAELNSATIPIGSGTTYATANGATASATIVDRQGVAREPFHGQSTGTALVGAYGLGVEKLDLASTDSVIDLGGTTITPPNNQTWTITGLVSGDQVLVGPWDGSSTDNEGNAALDKDQLSLSGPLNSDNVTEVIVQEATIPSDTPDDCWIRVTDDAGMERRLHVASWSGASFTIDTTDGQEDFLGDEAADGNDLYITYIDKTTATTSESFTGTYSSPRNLVVIVRDGGGSPIKQFLQTSQFTSTGGGIAAIRDPDL